MSFKEFVQGITGEQQESGSEAVGVIDLVHVERLNDNEAKHDAQHEEIERKIEEFVEQMKAEHEPHCEAYQQEKSKIWNDIYDELLIPEEKRTDLYSIDNHTGIVTRRDPVRAALDQIIKGIEGIIKE